MNKYRFRGITFISIFYKIFNIIQDKIVRKRLETNVVLNDFSLASKIKKYNNGSLLRAQSAVSRQSYSSMRSFKNRFCSEMSLSVAEKLSLLIK